MTDKIREATIGDAPEFLNTNDKAMWVLGFNEGRQSLQEDSKRLDAIENGFAVWQTINLDDGKESWHCQHSIGGVVCADTLREAIDKGIEANDARTNSKS